MEKLRTKIISEVDTGENVIGVKKPFRLSKDKQRRYIRLEISEPMTFDILRDRIDGFKPQADGSEHQGSILNISAGGVLLLTETVLDEGTILVMKMTLQEMETIDKVIGVVKRADRDEDEWLVGIEFISREYLVDHFSAAELELLTEGLDSFDERLKNTLNKYVYYRKVSHEKGE
jgi:c-di-GMP-binding flagellar brake protein YcgR